MGTVIPFPVKVVTNVSFEINLKECSFCYLIRVIKNAGIQGKVVTTNESRRFNRRRAKGFDVRVNGRKLYWMNKMPTECECEPR